MKKEMGTKEGLRRLLLQLALPGPMVLLGTLLFWSLGGGGTAVAAGDKEKKEGLNVQVPAPVPAGKAVDKLAMYNLAQMDSMRKAQREKGAAGFLTRGDSGARFLRIGDSLGTRAWAGDSNERRVMQLLAELKARWHSSPEGQPGYYPDRSRLLSSPPFERANRRPDGSQVPAADLDRLERLMATLKQSGSAGSPEMQELNRTLDKLIAVQQPARAKPGIASTAGLFTADSSTVALRVLAVGKEAAISGMQPAEPARNQFYDLESNDGGEQPTGTAIEAIVPETQTLVNGSAIRLELATELMIRGQRVAKGTTMYGTARLSNERLQVGITSIRSGKEVFPVALRVLDQDGLAGIYSPGSATRDAAQESASEAAASLGPAGLDASPSGQALSAGIQLARNLARRKVQLIRVTVKAGYRVFLQDESKGH